MSEQRMHEQLEEWTVDEMEHLRLGHPCFDFFLGRCAHMDKCNYSHAPIHQAQLENISPTASKESVGEAIARFRPLHIAYTGNPAPCNFGRGCGIIAFSNLADLASSVKATQGQAEGVRVKLTKHECVECGCPMRFNRAGVPYFKSSSVCGTRKDPKPIAKQALADFECGECRGGKKVASSQQPRALKQGEVEW
jgi:hypothetical protein